MSERINIPPAVRCLASDVRRGYLETTDINEARNMLEVYYPEGSETIAPEWLVVLAGGNPEEFGELVKLTLEELEGDYDGRDRV